jgi:hypothetical protein
VKPIVYRLTTKFLKWAFLALLVSGITTAILYWLVEPQQNRDWTPAHARLAAVEFNGEQNNPAVTIHNLRDFQWQADNPQRYQNMQFTLDNIVELKAVVSHFSALSEIAHVFMTFVLDDGRELGVSIEARREQGEEFSLSGGLLAGFELIYVLATPQDLLGIRKINQEAVHIYPIKETKEKAQQLFLLIANEINTLNKKPSLYHLFFKNCTNQLVKHVSILTQQKYPWYFQTLAPGLTGRTLYELDLIDLPDTGFEDIQTKTLLAY